MDFRNVSMREPNDNFIVELNMDAHLQIIKMYSLRISIYKLLDFNALYDITKLLDYMRYCSNGCF